MAFAGALDGLVARALDGVERHVAGLPRIDDVVEEGEARDLVGLYVGPDLRRHFLARRVCGLLVHCVEHLAEITGKAIRLAPDLVEATQDTQPFVLYSSCQKSVAIKLSKICNDLRLLSSGPRAGFNEINLPRMQPGSTIMPGKVNPVIPEVVNQVCFRAIGNDLTVTLAAEAGQLQLNVMEPVIADCILESQTMFMNAVTTLRVHCVEGITANQDICREYIERSIGVVTALNPVLGYDATTELAKEALETGKGIVELVREKGLLTEAEIEAVMDPARMADPQRNRQ